MPPTVNALAFAHVAYSDGFTVPLCNVEQQVTSIAKELVYEDVEPLKNIGQSYVHLYSPSFIYALNPFMSYLIDVS